MPTRPLHEVVITIKERSRPTDIGCHVWAGCSNRKGYGYIRLGGKMVFVTHAMWMHHHGQIPDGLHILHRCDNPKCTNIRHLFLGTNAENIADKCAKDRSGKKLNIAKVREIKQMLASGISQTSIARKFGVTSPGISKIASGLRWKHVLLSETGG